MFPLLILQDQDCFAGEAGAEELLSLLPGGAQVDPLRKKWKADPDRSSEEKWDDLRNQVKIHGKKTASGVSFPLDAKRSNGDPIGFCRGPSWPRWKTSSSNTRGPESMRKSRSIETTCSKLPFASTQRQGGCVYPWIQRESRNSIRLACQSIQRCNAAEIACAV